MKYWTYMKGEVPGSYEPDALAALPDFTMTTLVCPGEGEIAEKNWRRAGEFDDIVQALEKHQATIPPAAPLRAPPTSNEVDALLDTASTRLFSHVADLMKELETRRDEKSLINSLQRQISALKTELNAARETATMLEIRIPRIAELEETIKKDQSALAQLQANLTARENQYTEMRMMFERMRGDFEGSKRRVQETESDLGIRNRLVDKLSRDLSDKELSLAKALGVIRRLEEDLNRLCPSPEMLLPATVPDPVQPPPPAPEALPPAPLPVVSFTKDDPQPPTSYIEPHHPAEPPKAHEALMGFLRKVFPGQSH
ncbi:MAG: hypothetical protein AAB268_02830 [Elusimicrobiota bacterium]